MPDVKISGLPDGTVTGNSTVPAVTSGVTHKTTVQSSTVAGLASLNVNVGNNSLCVGTAAAAGTTVRIEGPTTASSNISNAVLGLMTVRQDATSSARVFSALPTTEAASFTCSQLVGFYSGCNNLGAGSSVTSHIGFLAESSMTKADSNFGFLSNINYAAGTNRWNFYSNGTAPNYFGGHVRIGTTSQILSNASVFDVVGGRSTFVDNSQPYSIGLKYSFGSSLIYYLGVTWDGTLQFSVGSGVGQFHIAQAGHACIGSSAALNSAIKLVVDGNAIRITTAKTPASATDAGTAGQICWDANYIYVCVTTGVAGSALWKRVAIAAW